MASGTAALGVLPDREIYGIPFVANAQNKEQLSLLVDSPKVSAVIPAEIRGCWHELLNIIPEEYKFNIIRFWGANEDLLLFVFQTAQALRAEGVDTIYGIGAGCGLFEAMLAKALQVLYGAGTEVKLKLMEIQQPEVAFAPIDLYEAPKEEVLTLKMLMGEISYTVPPRVLAIPAGFFAEDCSKSILSVIMPRDLPAPALDAYLAAGGRRLIGSSMALGTGAFGFGPQASLKGDVSLLEATFAGRPGFGVIVPQIRPYLDYNPAREMQRSFVQVQNFFVLGISDVGHEFLKPYGISKPVFFYNEPSVDPIKPIPKLGVTPIGCFLKPEARQASYGDFWNDVDLTVFNEVLEKLKTDFYRNVQMKTIPDLRLLQRMAFILGGEEQSKEKAGFLKELQELCAKNITMPADTIERKLAELIKGSFSLVSPAAVNNVAITMGLPALEEAEGRAGAGCLMPTPPVAASS